MGERLAGRVAIVTGAASGMGAATSRLFAREGARVIAVDLPGEGQAVRVAEPAAETGRIDFVGADVAESSGIRAMVDAAVGRYGRLDVLYNNAGYNLVKSLESTSDEEYERCLDVNLRAVFLACRAALPVMMRQRAGVILSTASSAGIIGRPALPVYAAAKGGVVLLTKSLAVAVGPYGIRVNCICPGTIRTPMFETSVAGLPDPELAVRRVAETCALRRIGAPEDIAHEALFLASDEAAYITGVALPVDGGRTAGVQEAQAVFDTLASPAGPGRP